MREVTSLLAHLLILGFFITKVSSIECYVCQSKTHNCQSGERDCTTLYDRCMKRRTGNLTIKDCSSQILCNAGCIGKKDCEVDCCSGDLCNASSALPSSFMIVILSVVLVKAMVMI